MNKQELYRSIPKVDRLMEGAVCTRLVELYGEPLVLSCVRDVLEDLRRMIGETDSCDIDVGYDRIEQDVCQRVGNTVQPGLKKVINATGTILHTNLGRAPIGREIAESALETITGYTNIEYDLQTGQRGPRGGRCEELLMRLTGAQDALVVNNNAAAVLLILHTLGQGYEVIVSRGELVEIGGHFRIPDVMQASGCTLREVGTTNKTRVEDYRAAINDKTAALMKVHTSNYRIVGFTDVVSTAELADLAHEHDLPMIEDLGSGALADLASMGIGAEPTVKDCVGDGADLICFSADKLLGGLQAGIILGKGKIIDKLRHHPMMRALRTDKFTAAVLERTLIAYLNDDQAMRDIPVLAMAGATEKQLQDKAVRLADELRAICGQKEDAGMKISVEPLVDQIGGGALPLEELPGYGVRISGSSPAGEEVRAQLMEGAQPVVPRFHEGDLLLSVRTIDEDDFADLCKKVSAVRW